MLHFNATTFLRERICEFVFQDGVRFYIYFDSDYELDADSVEEKNKVRPNLVFNWNALTLLPHQCIYDRVRTGHGKPGKSWNFRISFPGLESHGI